MDALRRLAAVLLGLALLAPDARAQPDAGATPPRKPIPYAELTRSRASRGRRPPLHKPKPAAAGKASPAAAGAARSGGAAGAPIRPSPPPVGKPAAPPAPALVQAPPLPPGLRPSPVAAPVTTTPAPPPASTSGAAPPATGAAAAPPTAEVEAFVDAAMARDLLAGRTVGAAVAVVQNGQVVLEKGYGLADRATRRPFDPARTGVRLGTASRLLTDVLALKLAEAGRLDLTASADAALPPLLRLPSEGFGRTPRLSEVLQERGGFETRTFGRMFVAADRLLPLDVALRRLRPRRVRDPGGPAIENPYGTALAGAAAAHAAGTEFETLAQTALLAPVGMASSSFREPRPPRDGLPAPLAPLLADRLAQGYAWGPHGAQPQAYGFAGSLAPALAATTTADDMARLMLVELNGGRTAAGGEAWGPRTQAWLHAGPAAGQPVAGQAFGRMRVRLPGGFAGYGGAGAAPGFRVDYLVVPQLGLGVFVAATGDGSEAVRLLAPALVRRFYAPADVRPGRGEPGGLRPGLYLDARRAYHGLEGFLDRLHRLVRLRRGGDGAMVTRGLGRTQAWTPLAGDAWSAADGSEMVPLAVAAGRAEALAQPGEAVVAERVGWFHRPATLAWSALAAALVAALTLGGLFARLGREGARPTGQQTAAAGVQALAAALWLGAMGAFALFVRGSAGGDGLLRPWPDPWLVGASAAALGAAVLSLVGVLQLPGALAEGRRLAGWAVNRKLRHSATVLVFAAFAALLAAWGALEPWSS